MSRCNHDHIPAYEANAKDEFRISDTDIISEIPNVDSRLSLVNDQEFPSAAIGQDNKVFDPEEDLPVSAQCIKNNNTSDGDVTAAFRSMDPGCCVDVTYFGDQDQKTTVKMDDAVDAPLTVINKEDEVSDMTYMEKKYGLFTPTPKSKSEMIRKFAKSKCKFSCSRFLSLLLSLFPVVSWLPQYELKYLLYDAISGFTIAIMHIPQGMAYGILALVGAENGLYVSFFPVLIYFALGTSRHGSIGTFAVISLMVNSAVIKMGALEYQDYNITQQSGNDYIAFHKDLGPPTNVQVATSLSMGVGIWQLLMGLLQLGSLEMLLSDQMISGFTTGAAVHVATSQMKYLFGIHVGSYSGPLKLIYMYIDIFSSISESNIATVIVSAVSILILAVFKEHVDHFFKKKCKISFPIDLVVLIFATVVSYFGEFNERYGVNIIGDIPTGLPSPEMPRMDLLPHLMMESFTIAVVIFAISLSMAKFFAKKHNYKIDARQELFAIGGANVISSFFACFPASIALARSSVQESSGGKTQIAGVVSCSVLLVMLLFLSSLFYCLPKCILSAIILVALKRVIMQITDFVKAWEISKADAIIWVTSFLATVLIDVSYGLVAGVLVSIGAVIVRTALPKRTFLGHIPDTDIYLDLKRYSLAKETPGVKIFQFQSPLYFLNKQLFRTILFENVPAAGHVPVTEEKVENSCSAIHHIIIDCSPFVYVDMSGLETLKEIIRDYKSSGISVYLTGCPVSMYDLMVRGGFFTSIATHPCLFPTIHEAIRFCSVPIGNKEAEEEVKG